METTTSCLPTFYTGVWDYFFKSLFIVGLQKISFSQVQQSALGILATLEAEAEDDLSPGAQDRLGQHSRTPSLRQDKNKPVLFSANPSLCSFENLIVGFSANFCIFEHFRFTFFFAKLAPFVTFSCLIALSRA